MPDSHNHQDRDFSQYDAMDEEQLRQILRDDASKPEGEESDMELLLYVMEVLAKRRKESKDPEAALASFKKNYCTNDVNSLISEKAPAARKRSGGNWKRGLITIAAMLALVIGCSVTANALGYDVWATVAKWTQETFHFGYASQVSDANAPDKEDATPYQELQNTLEKHNIQIALVPTWIPEGYEAAGVEVYETPMQRQFFALYLRGEDMIKVQIQDYIGSNPEQIEKSELLEEVYNSSGIDFYIFSNKDLRQVVWTIENYECFISGPLTLSEIEEMIDSIEKG